MKLAFNPQPSIQLKAEHLLAIHKLLNKAFSEIQSTLSNQSHDIEDEER